MRVEVRGPVPVRGPAVAERDRVQAHDPAEDWPVAVRGPARPLGPVEIARTTAICRRLVAVPELAQEFAPAEVWLVGVDVRVQAQDPARVDARAAVSPAAVGDLAGDRRLVI
jgi:hypothetical protein